MNKEGTVYIMDVIAVFALIVGVAAFGYAFMKPTEKGDVGPQGARGLQGINGTNGGIGPQGPSGAKGDKGDHGVNGTIGRNGTDYINSDPTISLIVTDGNYTETNGTYLFTFRVSAMTNDDDNETVQTMVYYRQNTVTGWMPLESFFTTNQTIMATKSYYLDFPTNQRMYWCILAWDGKDITVEYAEHLVLYP